MMGEGCIVGAPLFGQIATIVAYSSHSCKKWSSLQPAHTGQCISLTVWSPTSKVGLSEVGGLNPNLFKPQLGTERCTGPWLLALLGGGTGCCRWGAGRQKKKKELGEEVCVGMRRAGLSSSCPKLYWSLWQEEGNTCSPYKHACNQPNMDFEKVQTNCR